MKNYSRREFLLKNSAAGIGLALSGMIPSLFAMPRQEDLRNPSEPIIDIHQHTDYRPDRASVVIRKILS